MDRNASWALTVLSLLGLGLTFQMAEDTMNREIEWIMEASLMDYVNPLALGLCLAALAVSLGGLALKPLSQRFPKGTRAGEPGAGRAG